MLREAVKDQVLSQLKSDAAVWAARWDGREPSQKQRCIRRDGDDLLTQFHLYVEKLTENGAWGGQLEVAAAAAAYDIQILVFSKKAMPTAYNWQGTQGRVGLWYGDLHYQAVMGDIADHLMQAIMISNPDDCSGGRGGGGSTRSGRAAPQSPRTRS